MKPLIFSKYNFPHNQKVATTFQSWVINLEILLNHLLSYLAFSASLNSSVPDDPLALQGYHYPVVPAPFCMDHCGSPRWVS